MLKSIMVLLAIVAYHDYKIWQIDVKITFFNGNIKENVYMIARKGFVSKTKPHKICKLQKSIYKLKLT